MASLTKEVLLSAFLDIAAEWQLTFRQQTIVLGCISRPTLSRIRKAPELARISRDGLERMSCILDIHRTLQLHFLGVKPAGVWISNIGISAVFGGCTALDLMVSGSFEALYLVRRHIELQVIDRPWLAKGKESESN